MSGSWSLIQQTAIVAAVKVAVNAVPSLVAKVSTLAKNGIQSVFGAANEVEDLRVALTKIEDVIRDAENVPPTENQALSDWLERLKKELRNAQSVLDEYEKSELRRRIVDPITNKARRLFNSAQMTSRLEEVTKGLQAIEEESHELNPSETIVIETSKKEEMTTGLEKEEFSGELVGKDGIGIGNSGLNLEQKNFLEQNFCSHWFLEAERKQQDKTGLCLLTADTGSDQWSIDDGMSPRADNKPEKSEFMVIQAEIDRINDENQRLNGLLSLMCRNTNALQMQIVSLMQQQNNKSQSPVENETADDDIDEGSTILEEEEVMW